MGENSENQCLLIISICTPKPIIGFSDPDAERLQRNSEHQFISELLKDCQGCTQIEISDDEMLCWFTNADSAFYAACELLVPGPILDTENAPYRIRLLLENLPHGTKIKTDEFNRLMILIHDLPAGRIYATYHLMKKLSPAVAEKFTDSETALSGSERYEKVFQANCKQNADTLMALPTQRQKMEATEKSLCLRCGKTKSPWGQTAPALFWGAVVNPTSRSNLNLPHALMHVSISNIQIFYSRIKVQTAPSCRWMRTRSYSSTMNRSFCVARGSSVWAGKYRLHTEILSISLPQADNSFYFKKHLTGKILQTGPYSNQFH